MTDLNPDGPHSPERTAEAGQFFDDCSRLLTYATMAGKGGLESPAVAYRLTADLYSATGRFPQIFEQLEGFLRALEAARRLREAREGRQVGQQVNLAAFHLGEAADAAEALTKALQAVQADIAGLALKDGTDG
jgi:hypothetical protein